MSDTKFDICNDALLSIGADMIANFTDSSQEAIACSQLFERTAKNQISLYPWRFATTQLQLARDIDPPLTGWDASYSEPADMLSLEAVLVGDCPIEFARFNGKILCDVSASTAVYASFTYFPDVLHWPSYFKELITLALMKKLSFALAAKLDLKKDVSGDLEVQFRLAKNADARQQTTKRLPVNGPGSLIMARRM